ncbi:hypothetical protein I307_05003 [Cryptococcus deuterogattii 99/473]|uniref:Mei2-like C-terminal RNA recognition motif domain-containing protein n=1 Tax=Cryptococcus deuterogattii Ram5 TaxID=1296110 RepID=A0A0D0USB3_9TREE|nr:hypothetical protein I309_04231 [Cryptococcus deuterogattii LA55]KIR38061.1 hypothetical protein I313_06056 [Cryptococcus deuterogattii Ram5]KIR94405.1 hypothetical protein I304_02047 [Cryptococcus deuterogattii CBS 10090]KIR96810.1 hypothetical protein L804_05908 [Cryptococcus deuterogattii 2001/935-1]KIY55606.1 hypothetical protein I307_05003 [Cryptococcus deuterogattii 99/473]
MSNSPSVSPRSKPLRPFAIPIRKPEEISKSQTSPIDGKDDDTGFFNPLWSTPSKKKEDWTYQTPPRFSLASTFPTTPGLTSTPFTPLSSFTADSHNTPHTPYTPGVIGYRRHSDSSDELNHLAEKVTSASVEHSIETLGRYLLSMGDFKALIVKHLKSKGCIIVAFHDSRQNLKVYERLQAGPVAIGTTHPIVQLQCMPVTRDMVETVTGHGGAWDQVWKTSVSTIKIEIKGGHPVTTEVMENVMQLIGDVRQIDPIGYDGREFVVDFYDTRDAAQAIADLNGRTAGEALLCVDYHAPRNKECPYSRHSNNRTFSLGSAAYIPGCLNLRTPSNTALDALRTDDFFSCRASSLTPSKRSVATPDFGCSSSASWSLDKSSSDYETPPRILSLSRRLSEAGTVQGLVNRADIAARARQKQGLGGHWDSNDRKAIPEQNRVFPERIMADSRTTVMVKDVPVGYAFVNFCSVQSLLRFIQARVGKKWNLFSSEKVLQVSYADIQGKLALINKFRNSAVMGVIEPWRPQIFYSSGALKGQPSDNLAVRERSKPSQTSIFSTHPLSLLHSQNRLYDYTSASFDHSF